MLVRIAEPNTPELNIPEPIMAASTRPLVSQEHTSHRNHEYSILSLKSGNYLSEFMR